MNPFKHLLPVTVFLIAQAMSVDASAKDWIDAVSFTYGQDEDSNDVDVYRRCLVSRRILGR